MFKRFKELPRRQQVGFPAGTALLGISIWAIVERGLFDGLTLFIACMGLLLGLLPLLPVRPKLRLTARASDSTRLVFAPERPVRPLDEEAIVKEQTGIALAEMPRKPTPKVSPTGPFADTMAALSSVTKFQHALSEFSDERLRRYQGEVRDYAARLRNWVGNLEVARADRLRVFKGDLRIHELGQADADHVRLRLRFPEGFELDEGPMELGPPPEQPTFKMDFVGFKVPDYESLVGPDSFPDPKEVDASAYSLENDRPVINFELGHLNQADHLDIPNFTLKSPRQPGAYEVGWEVSASGLARSVKGKLTIEIQEAQAGDPITNLTEADDERQLCGLY